MHYVTGLFSRTPAPMPASNSNVVVHGKRNGLVEALIQIARSTPAFWEKANMQQLRWMKNILVKSELDKEHDFSQKVDQALLKCSKTAKGYFSGLNPESLESIRRKEGLLANRTPITNSSASTSATKLSQNNLRLDQVKAIIEANGSQFLEIDLWEVNDELLQLIAEKCPQLTSFTVSFGLGTVLQHLTDKGIGYIGQLTQLTKLQLDTWMVMYVTQEAFQNLLSVPQLQNNLKELSLMTPQANNDALKIIAQYKQLNKLSLWSASITPAGSEPLVQSPTLKATLQSLDIRQLACWGTIVTDPVLKALSAYPNLKELSFNGQWEATDPTLQSLLQAQQNLTKLKLDGFATSPGSAAKISTMTSLQELHLGDCSQLAEADYTTLLQSQNNLTSLSFDNCVGLTDNSILPITLLSNLRSLSLLHCSYLWHGINALTVSPNMQKNLEYFHISNNEVIPSSSLGSLGKLTNLKTLRVDSCPKFNDDSLRELIHSPIKNTLEALELNNVSIADGQVGNLAVLNKLQTLMLARCSAITKLGTVRLLNSPVLHTQLLKFYIDGAVITDEMVKEFKGFQNLQVLIVGNPDGLSFQNEGGLFNLPNLKKLNTQVELFYGDLTPFEQFEKAT